MSERERSDVPGAGEGEDPVRGDGVTAPGADAPEAGDASEAGQGAGDEAAREAVEAESGSGGAKESADARPGSIRVRCFGKTDVGLVREHNEDNFLIGCFDGGERYPPMDEVVECDVGPRGLLFAVCDGMGGANAGEVASQMAVDTIHEVMAGWDAAADRDVFAHHLVKAVERAGERIFAAAKMDPELRGMGTTATVAGLVDEVLFVGQVGDSRAYVLREGRLGLLTKDQSLVNQLIEAGQLSEEDAESFELGNIILQALGTTESVNVDLSFLKLRRGDRLMISSDGLTGLVHDEVLLEVLQEVEDPRACCDRLVEMANAGGGHDNITVIVVDFDGEGLEAPDGEARPGYYQYPLPVLEEPTPIRKTSRREPSRKLSEERVPLVSGGGASPSERETWANASPSPAQAEGRGGKLKVVLTALAVLLVAGFLLLRSSPGGAPSLGEPVVERSRDGVPEESVRSVRPVSEETDVTVRLSFPEAELFVDGRSFGRANGGVARLRLPPGVYLLEARLEGAPVASRRIRVDRAHALTVSLTVPAGMAVEERDGGVRDAAVRDAARRLVGIDAGGSRRAATAGKEDGEAGSRRRERPPLRQATPPTAAPVDAGGAPSRPSRSRLNRDAGGSAVPRNPF